jgi:hypothetical protein
MVSRQMVMELGGQEGDDPWGLNVRYLFIID